MRRGRRRPPALALLLLACPLAGAAPSRALAEPRLEVLLLEDAPAVRVRGGRAGAAGIRLTPRGSGLSADGQPIGDAWRSESLAGDPLQVGEFRVRGALEVRRSPAGLRVVNRIGLEDYVAGTLAREVYPTWEPEMLKAQAVVARTYGLYRRARRSRAGYDVEASTDGQVYGGVDAEMPATVAAVAATHGEILTHDGAPILAVYHSASGGRTASAEEVWGRPVPYLVSAAVEDEEDSPDTYWRASIPRTTLGPALAPLGVRVGDVRGLRVSQRTASGRAAWVVVEGAAGTERIEARALRRALGDEVIRSTLFEIRPGAEGFVIVGSGHGHGVGMSQWGARGMARRGAGYREILAAFYPGCRLGRAAEVAAR